MWYSIIFVITWLLHSLFAASGLGGSIVLVPIYIAFGISVSIAASLGLLMNVTAMLVLNLHSLRHNYIKWKMGLSFLVPAVALTPAGTSISSFIPRNLVLGVFVFLLALALAHILVKKKESHVERLRGPWAIGVAAAAGSAAGFLSGISGIGGGIIVLPALTFMESDYKRIAGTTGLVVLFISLSSFITHLPYIGGAGLYLIIIAISGSLLGGATASVLLHKLSSSVISIITAVVVMTVMALLTYLII